MALFACALSLTNSTVLIVHIGDNRLLSRHTYRTSHAFLPLQRHRHPAQIEIDDHAGLRAGDFEDDALLVREHRRLRPAHDGSTCAARAVHAFDIARAADVARGAAQVHFRYAERKSIGEAADRKRIAAVPAGQRARARGAADHPAGFDELDADRAGVGEGRGGKRKGGSKR